MSVQERQFKGTATTIDATPTDLFTLTDLPPVGGFMLSGTIVARALVGGLQTTTFFPANTGTIVAGAVSQSAGRDQAPPCLTSPADGGTAQGFAPPGCSTLTNGAGTTTPLDVTGVVAALSVVGIVDVPITWTWDVTLVVVSP